MQQSTEAFKGTQICQLGSQLTTNKLTIRDMTETMAMIELKHQTAYVRNQREPDNVWY